MSAIAPIPADDQKTVIQNAVWIHALPFIAWVVLMSLLAPASGVHYAVRTAVGLALLLYMAPWRWYPALRIRNLPGAMGVGALVFGLWVFPETAFVQQHFPGLYRGYLLLGVVPPWSVAEWPAETPYAPEICGWPLTAMRLFGSAVVIAIIEEFFWRGFLYRWLVASNFLKIDLGFFRWSPYLITALMFSLVHDRVVVGFLTGLIYGAYVIRTRDVWAACVAHGVTNFLLGLYVLVCGRYEFW